MRLNTLGEIIRVAQSLLSDGARWGWQTDGNTQAKLDHAVSCASQTKSILNAAEAMASDLAWHADKLHGATHDADDILTHLRYWLDEAERRYWAEPIAEGGESPEYMPDPTIVEVKELARNLTGLLAEIHSMM